MATETLELRYVPVSYAQLWEDNPKRHDLDALIRSIATYGFGDPPKFDATLQALVYGNGRSTALRTMAERNMAPPRGIGVSEDGEWLMPVIFGVDAESRAAAVAFAVDHNNLTLLGGDLGFLDALSMWDEEGLKDVLSGTPDAAELLVSLDSDELASLLEAPDFEPVAEDEQSRLDQKKTVCCPECGHEFAP